MKKRSKIVIGVILLGLVAADAFCFIRYQVALTRQDALYRIRNLMFVCDRLTILLLDAETGERGFVITGRPEYLDSIESAVRESGGVLNDLKDYQADHPDEVAQLTSEADHLLHVLVQTVRTRQYKGYVQAQDMILTGQARDIMSRLRQVITSLRARTQEDAGTYFQKMNDAFGQVTVLLILNTLIAFLVTSLTLTALHERPPCKP